MVSGQWSVVSGQWSVVSGQWSVGSGQWAGGSGRGRGRGWAEVFRCGATLVWRVQGAQGKGFPSGSAKVSATA